MDKFDLIEAIIKRVDVLADARGAQKCAIVIEIIQQLGALRKGMADEDAARKKEIMDLERRLDAMNTTKEE